MRDQQGFSTARRQVRGIGSNMAMRAVMTSYGASVQDEKGNVVINSKQTLEAVKFVRALFKEAMTPEVLN
jgi:hypothetical protein